MVAADHVYSSPGFCDEDVLVYLAEGLTDVERPEGFVVEHEEADMTVERVPLADAVQRVFDGDIRNSLAVIGLLAAAQVRASEAPAAPRRLRLDRAPRPTVRRRAGRSPRRRSSSAPAPGPPRGSPARQAAPVPGGQRGEPGEWRGGQRPRREQLEVRRPRVSAGRRRAASRA